MSAPSSATRLPYRLGLTGGIASGKTAVAERFAQWGIPVIDTDQIARAVVAPGMPALREIAARFGPEALDANGMLDRRRMRERVFRDDGERRALEAILHPAIRAEQERLAAALGGTYQVHVAPLLVETHTADRYDRVLVVDCPRQMQFERLVARDGIDAVLAHRMLDAQATREQRLALADDILENSGSLEALTAKVDTLHQQYLELATRHGRAAPPSRSF